MTSRGEQTRERILSTAAELILRRGFRATSVNELTAATGVNRGSLYFHFPGKDDLGMAVLKRARDQFLDFVKCSLKGKTPGQQLDALFRAALDRNTSRQFVGGCLWGNTALEMSDADGREQYVDLVREVFELWAAMLEDVIAKAQGCGEVRADIPADGLARQAIATIEGGIMLSRLSHAPGPLHDCLDNLRVMLGLRPAKQSGREEPGT